MPINIINAIDEAIASTSLREALVCQDYETARDIIDAIIDEIDCYPDIFSIFDCLLLGIQNNDVQIIKETIMRCERLFYLNTARNIIIHYASLDNKETVSNILTTKYFKYLKRYPEIVNIDIDTFIKNFLAAQDKPFKKLSAFQIVMEEPFYQADEDCDDYVVMLVCFLYGAEVTYEDVIEAYLDNNPDALMEKVLVVKYLREIYYDVKKPQIDKKIKALEEKLAFGLERRKPEN